MTDANSTALGLTNHVADGAYVLPQMLDLTQASQLRDEMVRLASAGDIVLDASGVERMSTPCVQILLAAARGAGAAHKSFKITQASELFRTAVTELGLGDELDHWME
ncbi:STAS domain-containing protein [Bradyrhizobium sp. HKCCYLRH3099]|uniref:STAS domain-containing protein n=1 Tax=unclassified Bradyrhizobium TaxID=2631580 RepID=UPI003EBAE15C